MLVTARVQNLCMAKFHSFSQHTNNTSSFLHSQFVNTSAYKIVVHMMDRKRFHMTFVFVVLTDFNNTRIFTNYINTICSNIFFNIDKKVVESITYLSLIRHKTVVLKQYYIFPDICSFIFWTYTQLRIWNFKTARTS